MAGGHIGQPGIVVGQKEVPSGYRVASGLEPVRAKMAWLERVVGLQRLILGVDRFDCRERRR